ncbi:hypothetical protein SUGI_1100480 [Cryptomeria japonica]|nr:hypothetical protein SUGI_1100480 [Cryptomeria japonica]
MASCASDNGGFLCGVERRALHNRVVQIREEEQNLGREDVKDRLALVRLTSQMQGMLVIISNGGDVNTSPVASGSNI